MDIYKKHEVPEHLHYKNNVRIGDLVIITKVGYGVYINNGTINWKINKGDHGFSNEEKSMFPIFIAHGPSFRKNFTVSTFKNVDIYPLMCLILGIQPAVNNGSLEIVTDMLEFTDLDNNFKISMLNLKFIFK
jgi:predicted AlkP superfamily pyrophosphatase or phosphodiesterase